jgi:hypothetical protein
MGWALITHPHHLKLIGNARVPSPMLVSEDCLSTAVGQGWIVLATDAQTVDPATVPAPRNPRRRWDV